MLLLPSSSTYTMLDAYSINEEQYFHIERNPDGTLDICIHEPSSHHRNIPHIPAIKDLLPALALLYGINVDLIDEVYYDPEFFTHEN